MDAHPKISQLTTMHPEDTPYYHSQDLRRSFSIARTPSPSHSSCSSPTSPEPVTPPHTSALPMLVHHHHLAAPGCPKIRTIPLPTISAELDLLLAYSMCPALSWDLTLSPPASPWTLSQPATDSPMPHLTIRLPSTNDQLVEVIASSAPFITVQDVLTSIHHTLQENVREIEYDYLSTEDQEQVVESYMRRCRCIVNSKRKEQTKRQGVKRVDLLMGRTTWLGLEESGEVDEWILRVT